MRPHSVSFAIFFAIICVQFHINGAEDGDESIFKKLNDICVGDKFGGNWEILWVIFTQLISWQTTTIFSKKCHDPILPEPFRSKYETVPFKLLKLSHNARWLGKSELLIQMMERQFRQSENELCKRYYIAARWIKISCLPSHQMLCVSFVNAPIDYIKNKNVWFPFFTSQTNAREKLTRSAIANIRAML